MPELVATLEASRKVKENDRKFFAQLNDREYGEPEEKPVDKWAEIQARVASGNRTSDPNDILTLQGTAAAQAGFGIGQGLGYTSGDETEWWNQ